MDALALLPPELLSQVYPYIKHAHKRWYVSTLRGKFRRCYLHYWKHQRTEHDEYLFTPLVYRIPQVCFLSVYHPLSQYTWMRNTRRWVHSFAPSISKISTLDLHRRDTFRVRFVGSTPFESNGAMAFINGTKEGQRATQHLCYVFLERDE